MEHTQHKKNLVSYLADEAKNATRAGAGGGVYDNASAYTSRDAIREVKRNTKDGARSTPTNHARTESKRMTTLEHTERDKQPEQLPG